MGSRCARRHPVEHNAPGLRIVLSVWVQRTLNRIDKVGIRLPPVSCAITWGGGGGRVAGVNLRVQQRTKTSGLQLLPHYISQRTSSPLTLHENEVHPLQYDDKHRWVNNSRLNIRKATAYRYKHYSRRTQLTRLITAFLLCPPLSSSRTYEQQRPVPSASLQGTGPPAKACKRPEARPLGP